MHLKNKVEKLAKRLGDDEWQFKSVGLKKGVWKRAGKDEWATRLHKDACVFLNRTDFEAGPGCALHLRALLLGFGHAAAGVDVDELRHHLLLSSHGSGPGSPPAAATASRSW